MSTLSPRITLQTLSSALLTALLFLFACGNANAAIEERQFGNPTQEKIYYAVLKQLRCLVCQNQSLADSDADLARDLRDKTYALVTDGSSAEDIVNFMVERYGDFVLYRPPFKATTWALWLGPAVLALLGLSVFWLITTHRSRRLAEGSVGHGESQHDDARAIDNDKLALAKRMLTTHGPNSNDTHHR